jgi:hypothetical protein
VLSSTGTQPIPKQSGALARFQLSARGRRMLASASHHRLRVQVSAREASGMRATTTITLIPYSIQGSPPPQSVTLSPTVQIAGTTAFVSSSGRGGIVAACYAVRWCHLRAVISSHGKVLAVSGRESLGAYELGSIAFRLTAAGQAALAGASGNQLAARARLQAGDADAVGQIDLVGYR